MPRRSEYRATWYCNKVEVSMLVVWLFMLSVIKCDWAVFGRWRAGRHLVAEVERGGGGETRLYDLWQEDAGGGRAVDAGGDADAGRVAVLQGRGGDAVICQFIKWE